MGYSSLNISSTIWDLKLKRMSKYKQVWTLRSYIFAPCIWLAQNYMRIWFRNVRSAKLKWKGCMRIWFRNVSSAKLKWKGCTRRIKHDCLFLYYGWLSWIFHSQLPFWLIFLVVFFLPITAICLVSLKKSQNGNITNFCIISSLFHHKYNDKIFSKGKKKKVSPRKQFTF